MVDDDGDGGGALGEEADGLVDQIFGEVEGGEVVVAEFPEAEGHATRATAGFEEAGGLVGKEAVDEQALGFPEAEGVRGMRVVDDRERVVEVGADGGGGDFFAHGAEG